VSTFTRIVCTLATAAGSPFSASARPATPAASGRRSVRDDLGLRLRPRHLAEGAFEIVGRGRAELPGCRLGQRLRRCEPAKPADQIFIGARRFGGGPFELAEDVLDAVERRQDERHRIARDGHAVAEPAHQRLGRMGESLEARQAEEPASPLDRVDEAEDVAEDRFVVRVALEADKLDVHHLEVFPGFGEELAQQIVHHGPRDATQLKGLRAQFRRDGFMIG
jgi:hypothetical protein